MKNRGRERVENETCKQKTKSETQKQAMAYKI